MRPPARWVRTVVCLITLAVASVASPSGVASAHTELDYSLPADGTTVGQVVSEISVGFTEPVTLIGNGFTVLDPQGTELLPFAVTDDDIVFRLQFEPPLGGGVVGVRYAVSSADGHVVEGSFSFTVAVEAPVVTTAAPTVPPLATVESTTLPTTTPATTVAPTDAPTTVETLVALGSGDDSETADADDASDGGSNAGVLIVIAVVVAAGAGAFVALRSRRSS